MSIELTDSVCVICRKNIVSQDDVVIVSKGRETLIDCSAKYGDSELVRYLQSNPEVVQVHRDCRKMYTNKRRVDQFVKRPHNHIGNDSDAVEAKSLRSSSSSFDWKFNCFFCEELCVEDSRHHDRCDYRVASTLEIRESVLQMCRKRLLCDELDVMALTVQSRLSTCCDLVAVEAVYHRKCHTGFFAFSTNKVGRPVDVGKDEAFQQLCSWLEDADHELLTLSELNEKAKSITGNSEIYSEKWLKVKLIEHYGEHIVFAEVDGRKNVICFRKMASYIISKEWHNRHRDQEDDGEQIIVTAARLIKFAVREMECGMDTYPSSQIFENVDLARKWAPSLLNTFLENLICSDIKKAALGHAIVQAVRPKSVIAPLLFGLGVSLDHLLGSKTLINILSRFGFCCSYDEITRFKQSVVQSVDDVPLSACPDSSFTQFSADNVDHNICTIDGLDTFHGMGIIAMSIPCSSAGQRFGDVPIRRLLRSTAADMVRNRGIPLLSYNHPQKSALTAISFKSYDLLCDLFHKPVSGFSTDEDILWHAGWFVTDACNPRFGWSGFMHELHQPNTSSTLPTVQSAIITMHPIIDQNPNELSTVYSTLLYVDQQAKQMSLQTSCVTFDQPLWLKAIDIVQSEKLNIVCRLGPFHMLMSFLGSIGKVMEGSGLVEALQCCFGLNAITHMLSGKAVKRAIRGHFLMDSALQVVLLKNFVMPAEDVDDLRQLYEDVVQHRAQIAVIAQSAIVSKIKAWLDQQHRSLSGESRTAKLWLQYCMYVDIVKSFIRAERLGDWELHLSCVSKMLNLLAATGHTNYAKSARLYLELMLQLPEDYPWLYSKFKHEGCHAVRRSARVWAALSTDLMIEQTLMRALKGRSGLTHGRGMTENVRLTWVKTIHKSSTIYAALCALADLDETSDSRTHPDTSFSQTKRDSDDIAKLVAWLEVNNPFDGQDCRLRSLGSGVSASTTDSVNCDSADEVGANIMKKLDNCVYSEVVMKKADRVKTLADITTVAAPHQKQVNLENGLLFSRLLIILSRESEIEPYFHYELTAVPSALFKNGFLRKADKAQLQQELIKAVDPLNRAVENSQFVVDGGCLLHKVKWQRGVTYAFIGQQYVDYLMKHYGSCCSVIFDGYSSPSIKDHEHHRRSGKCAPDVVIEEERTAYFDQSTFLANEHNKKCFIDFLTSSLQKAGHTVQQAHDDADTLIVQTALEYAKLRQPVIVVANDTDILVLLVYHVHAERENVGDVFMQSEVSSRKLQPKKMLIAIRDVVKALGSDVAESLLVVHAISGCDATSSLFGHGKKSLFRKLTTTPNLRQFLDVISSLHATQDDVISAGLSIMSCIYGGKPTDSLNFLRYAAYYHLVTSSTCAVLPERLPPTRNAAKFHVLRVHLQVLQWKTLMLTSAVPTDWGWKLLNGKFVPITTDKEIAPENILNVVRCKCNLSSRRPCNTMLCSCRKHGLECVTACKNCHGTDCENVKIDSDLLNFSDDEADSVLASSANLPIEPDDDLEFFIPWMNEEIIDF